MRPKDPTKRENYEGYEGASVSSTPISAYTILIGSADDVVLCACTMNVPKQSHYQSLTNLTQWDTEYWNKCYFNSLGCCSKKQQQKTKQKYVCIFMNTSLAELCWNVKHCYWMGTASSNSVEMKAIKATTTIVTKKRGNQENSFT